jgi:hypothetical protein
VERLSGEPVLERGGLALANGPSVPYNADDDLRGHQANGEGYANYCYLVASDEVSDRYRDRCQYQARER